VGRIQESEVTGARWYPLAEAERLVGHRIGRAVSVPPDRPTGPRWTLPPFAGLPAPARELSTLAESISGRRFRGSGVLLQTAAPGRSRVIRAAGLMPRQCRARGQQGRRDHRRSAAAAYAPGRRTSGTGVLARRPDARTRTCAERTGAAGHQCCRPVGSRTQYAGRLTSGPRRTARLAHGCRPAARS
jgi:hypothetical protein